MISFPSTSSPVHLPRLSILSRHGKQKHHHSSPKHNKSFKFSIRLSSPPSKPPKLTKSMDVPTSFLLPGEGVNGLLPFQALRSLVMFVNTFLLIFLLPFKGKSGELSNATFPGEKAEKKVVIRVPWRGNSGVKKGGDGATRRAIAIQRVLEDVDERCVRDYSLFVTARGDTLFTQSWTPTSADVKGLVVLIHGLNEHSGRYSDFAKQLNTHGYKVYGMDWIGHGGSDVLHAYVHSLEDAVKDLKHFLEKVVAENPRVPCFCFGHSTGAAIVLKVTMDQMIQTVLRGVILTSPAVRVQTSHPIFKVIAPIFSFLVPRYQFGAGNKKRVPVSRDPDALIAKYSDPLVYTGYIRARTGSEILRLSNYLQRTLKRITVPFLVLHGTADTVTDPEASRELYEEASSSDKSIRLYEGYLHDLLFEPEKDTIAKDIIEWLNYRVSV